MTKRDDQLTFYDWECPECDDFVNALDDGYVQRKGFTGVVTCRNCGRRFNLGALYAHGFVFENAA